MSHLKRLLEKREMTQAELAEALGVPRQRVYAWLSGREPVPRRFAGPIAAHLGCSPLDVPVSEAPHAGPRRGEPKTFLDWLVQFDAMSSHLGGSYAERVATVEERSGATPMEVALWLDGGRRVPASAAEALFGPGGCWPGLPAGLLAVAGELGREVEPAEALAAALASMAARTLPEAIDHLEVAWARRQADPTVPVVEAGDGLPGGLIEAKAREFGGDRG